MELEPRDRDTLLTSLPTHEEWLMERILYYAERQSYTRYTSTLKEAWRLSIEGLSRAIISALQQSPEVPEMTPDTDFINYPGARFGIVEARRHRARGVNLAMFLGLMKYYRQTYLDFIEQSGLFAVPAGVALYINRFFDQTEVAYCTEWSGASYEEQIMDLSRVNLSLTNEKNKYLTVFESLASPVLLYDENQKLVNYNYIAGRLLLGERIPGVHYYAENIGETELPACQDELEQLMSSEEVCPSTELTVETPEGVRIYDVKAERMLDVSRKFSGYTVIFYDITDQREWAITLEKINRRQQQLIDDLNKTRACLVQSEKMAAIGQRASGIAHEINTPAQYLRDNTQFLEESFTDLSRIVELQNGWIKTNAQSQELKEAVEVLQQELDRLDLEYLSSEIPAAISQSQTGIDRISVIVKAMQEFAGPGSIEKNEVDVNSVIRTTIEVAKSEWKNRARVELDLDPDLPPVHGVAGELNQAFLNIVVNAAHAIANAGEGQKERQGVIAISTSRAGKDILISIKDTGHGIPARIKSKIFEPFFTTRDVGKGSGQGLAIAYSVIVDKHGGAIEVESEPGRGATFSVRLPALSDRHMKEGGMETADESDY